MAMSGRAYRISGDFLDIQKRLAKEFGETEGDPPGAIVMIPQDMKKIRVNPPESAGGEGEVKRLREEQTEEDK